MNSIAQAKKPEAKASIRQQTVNMLIAVLLLLTLVFLLSSFILQRRENDDFKIRTTETAVENVASSISSSIDNYNYISRLIMMNEHVLDFLNAETADNDKIYDARMGIYDILNLYSNISYIESVYIFRNDGVFVNTGKADFTIDMTHSEWDRIYERQGARTLSISGNGMLRKNDGKPSLTFSRAIYDIYSQKLKGVLVMSISNNCFQDVLALQNTNGICILDENGNWLCGDDAAVDLYNASYGTDDLVCNTTYFKGKRSAVAGKKVLDPLIVLGYSYKVSDGLPLETILALILILGACFSTIAYYAGFIRVNLSGPIERLGQTMERTKSSGWKPFEEDMPNSDLCLLTDSYNSMIDHINELFEQLRLEEENMRKAELRILQEQIKPHFLYNTLETINYLAVSENAKQTYDALETLGSFYRNFLSKGAREIPFRRELNIAKDYLSLQKLRYGDSFEDEYDIAEDTLDHMVPKLILQPLVENSIYHGVRPKGELCTIRISARKDADGLHIWVYDSGVGMSEEKRIALQNSGRQHTFDDMSEVENGIGLTGTMARIRYYCNSDDVVTIRSEEGEFTEIELFIPIIDRKESERQDVQGNDSGR